MSTKLRALIVEDSEQDTLLLARELRTGGYDLTYERVETLEGMKAALDKQQWDIVLSDYTMPHFRGTDALLLLREKDPDTPFIYISGTIGEDMAVAAMKAGANDYIIKGNLKRLVPAIRRELKEAEVRRERRQAEESLRLLQSLALALGEAENLNRALNEVLEKICLTAGWSVGEAWIPSADGAVLEYCPAGWSKADGFEKFRERTQGLRFAMGQGLPGRAWSSRKPVWISDVTAEPSFVRAEVAKELGIKAGLAIPVLADQEVVAILTFFSPETHVEDQRFVEIVSAVAAQLGTVIKRKRAEEQTRRNLERIRALHEIDLAITSALDLPRTLDVFLDKLVSLLPYPTVPTISLWNREAGKLEPAACRNIDREEWIAHYTERDHGVGYTKLALESKTIVRSRNLQGDPNTRHPGFVRRHGLVSYLVIPLIAKEETLGVVGLYTKEEHDFGNEEIEFLTTLAGQAAIAIHNSQLYEEMAKLAGDLAKSNRVKDEFLSVMSHELRTPLNVVMGYAGMIKDGLLGEISQPQKEGLEKIINRGNDQLFMINNVLYATVLETEEIKIESHEVSLVDFLNQLRLGREASIRKELTLHWDYPPDLPVIKTDSGKLKQILQNLIDNAIKFTDKGSVTISARFLPVADSPVPRRGEGVNRRNGESGKEGSPIPPIAVSPVREVGGRQEYVELKVADTGIGISKQAQSIIFEKFRQLDSSETRLYGGVGLGLYIVKKLTELLGGKIEVESELGKGSTFTVVLPL